jgi:hypothetical protein
VIKTVENPEALLKAFVLLIEALDFQGVELRAAIIAGKGAELRLEALNQKALFPIHPLLHPSRKIFRSAAPDALANFYLSARIPDDLAADYRQAKINHGDLNGRLFIQAPWFILDRAPTAAIHRNPVSEPDLFSLKASRLPRALLSQRDRTWTQEELTQRTKISRGLVSRLLTTLTDRGYVTPDSTRSRHAAVQYRLADFDRLLDAWKAADVWQKRVTIQQYSALADNPDELAAMVRDALGAENAVFSQWFAAFVRHPYTLPPVVSTYVPKGRRLPDLRTLRAVPNGGNLWLIQPEDEGVFLETHESNGFRLVSDVQIYLDLLQMGQRGPDAAEALRAWDGFAR